MPDRLSSSRSAQVVPDTGSPVTEGSSNRSDSADRRARKGRALAGVVTRVPIDRSLLGRGDLLEGIVAVAALVLMVATGVTVWLAIPLAVVIYLGVAMSRPLRKRRNQTVDDADPERLVGRATAVPHPQVNPEAAARFGLTRRECEILPLLAQRLTDREIGERLSIGHRTAMNHSANILGKLGLASRRDVAAFAAQHGLLMPSLPLNGSE
jgi:DNA-binding CsgD family transcriptional regulator